MAKDALSWLAIAGAVCIAASSPYFVKNLLSAKKQWQKYPNKKIKDTFYNLRKRGLIEIKKQGKQIYIALTKEGKRRAGMFQIDNLKIKRPSKWDGKWRLVIFDISQLRKFHREAFRGKLKELGFYLLQKSIWINPFDCQAEIELLRDFFGLSENEIRLVTAENIGNDDKLKEFFKLR